MAITSGVQSVAVPGGSLAVETIAGSSEPIVCVHGISSTRRLFDWLHAAAPELTLVTIDLRGRGDSYGVEGTSSIMRHATDVAIVMDALDIPVAHICGMSMGGFVAIELAASQPERVKSLVLVDGGFPMASPGDVTREQIRAALDDRFARLERPWDSVEEYRDFFIGNTAPLLDPDDPLLLHYLSHDLSEGSVRLSAAALADDMEDAFFGVSHWQEVSVPIRFLRAQWSSGRNSNPGYPPDALNRFRPYTVSTVEVAGVDHAGIIMSPTGAQAVAAVIAEALA